MQAQEPGFDGGDPQQNRPAAAALKRRALIGGIALAGRTVVTQLIVAAGTVILARQLKPEEFGAFAIVQFALTFLTIFGDAGLGAALIQRQGTPERRELSSVFWVQVLIGVVVLLFTSAVAGSLSFFYRDLPSQAPWILRALALDFFATSLRVIPTLLMERELQFVRLSILDAVNTLAFYIGASILALTLPPQERIWALTVGVVIQSVVSLVLAYILRPWRPSFVIDRAALRPLLRFGIPFQLKYVLGMALGAIVPVWGGRVLGAKNVGFINWGQTTAHFPLRLVDIVSRVTFPLYSRLRDDEVEFASAIERSIRITGFGTLFFVGLILGLGRPFTKIVYSEQWLDALPLLYIYASTISIGFLTPVLATVFDALGDPQTILRLSTWVTVGIWLTVPPASLVGLAIGGPHWGNVGFASGYVAWMVIGNVAMLFILARRVPHARVIHQLRGPFVAAAAAALVARLAFAGFVTNALTLALAIIASAVIFLAVAAIVDPTPLRELWRLIRKR